MLCSGEIGGVRIHTVTSKVTWLPLKKISCRTIRIRPLAVGLLANYNFGKQYFLFSPEYFPYSYYGFPTAAHAGIFVGSQVNKQLHLKKSLKSIGLYYEIGTNDRELISYIGNRRLHLSDILNLGLGTKIAF